MERCLKENFLRFVVRCLASVSSIFALLWEFLKFALPSNHHYWHGGSCYWIYTVHNSIVVYINGAVKLMSIIMVYMRGSCGVMCMQYGVIYSLNKSHTSIPPKAINTRNKPKNTRNQNALKMLRFALKNWKDSTQ